jgi:NAD(P)H-dependent FMN reductase/NAD-dependent dihydropyrimidine dehydrogenase PreA subunit
MNRNIHAMYFSATGTTKKIVTEIAAKISEQIGDRTVQTIDFTPPEARANPSSFSDGDLVVFGTPVYAGRVPNVLLKYLNTLSGNGALAVAVVVCGNRHYDSAAGELQDILTEAGFRVIAEGAFVGEHAFSRTLGAGRPDAQDLALPTISRKKYAKNCGGGFQPAEVSGPRPYDGYYVPKNEAGEPVDIRKVKPKTNDKCKHCKICARVCPMGSIDFEDTSF